MERLRSAANSLERQIALSRYRFWGTTFLFAIMLVIIAYQGSQSNYVAIDPVGNVYTTRKVDRTDKDILLIEADAHARAFYSSFWTFYHLNRKKQLNAAVDLGGNCIKKAYEDLTEAGFYKKIETNNYDVKSEIDSVDVRNFSFDGRVLHLKVYGHMILENNAFIELRDLDMELWLVLVERIRQKNPNGLSIEGLKLLTNETLQVKEK
jgi:hypothetical protein